MANINLLSGDHQGKIPSRAGGLGGSLVLSFLVLAATIGAYFGAVFYSGMIQKSVDELKDEIASKKNLISGEKASRVADFSDRTAVIKENLSGTVLSPNDPLARIEQSLVPSVNFSSYEYEVEKRTVKGILSADSFRSIAEQLVTLKGENRFSSAVIDGDARVDSDGKITVTILLSL